MWAHIRANLCLLVLTLLICCVLYPAAVWVVGRVCFPNQAQGSLIDADGKPTDDESKAVGSRLIAQQFNSGWYFQPRPSAASYNAASSSGSNYGASSPKLRGRVAQLLGTISRYSKEYKKAHPKSDGTEPNPQDDIVAWFKAETNPTEAGKEKRDLFTEWASNNATLAQGWATGSAPISDYINQWAKDHSRDVIDAWKKDNPDNKKGPPGPDDVVVYFFKSYEKEHFGTWPTVEGGMVKPDAQDSDVQSTFFDTWLTEQVRNKKLDPLKDFEQVPADMVTTSGSGLDPDITLRNAQYQSETVVAANRGAKIDDYKKAHNGAEPAREQKDQVEAEIRKDVDDLLSQQAYRPMFGLTGDEQLVNVLQLNLSLKAKMAGVEIK